MKKSKILLPFVLLASFGMVTTLVSCTPKQGQKEEVPEEGYGVEIANKAALQETWYAGSSRNIDINLTPAGNVALELNKGNLKIESSNASVLSVTGQGLNALAEGSATVTVKYHGHKDSVDLTIEHKQTIQEKYGVAHAGTSADPLTNEEALVVAKHADYADGQEDLYVGGKIASFYHAPGSRTDGAVSWFLEPAEGQTEKFEVYKCYKEGTGEASYLKDSDVWVGGYAVAHGRFTVYNGQYETSAAIFDRCEGEPPAPRTTINATFAEALAAGKALEDGADSYNYYVFDAFVTKKSGSNYFLTASKAEAITDEKANTIEIYNAAAALDEKLTKNAKVTVKMILKNYHEQVENLLALSADDITVVEAGSPWVVPEHTVTVAQAIEVVNGLNDNQYTDDLYILTDVYVKEITEAYSSYGNMSFTVADTADGTNVITVFRAKTDAATAAKVVVGAQVTVKGQLQKNVYNNVTAPYLRNVDGITVKESGEGGGGEEQGTVVYKLDGTVKSSDNDAHDASNYTKSFPLTQNGVAWDVYGNTTVTPWRIGGKNIADGVDRKVSSKAAVTTEAVTKVVVTLGDITIASFNSLKLSVGTAQDDGSISEITITSGLVANGKITFEKPASADWSNRYFALTFNVTESGTSNKYVHLSAVEFYK